MCYSVFMSTSSPEDLASRATPLITFHKRAADETLPPLLHDHQWFVGSKSGCSCTFRHATSAQLGFGKPEEWYPDEPDEIAATATFIAMVRQVLADGYEVDCVDLWAEGAAGKIVTREVDLAAVSDQEFRFFENVHFVFSSG